MYKYFDKDFYPKVLIINQQSIKKKNATGITLRSLWVEWPDDKVLEIYLRGLLMNLIQEFLSVKL